MTTVANDKLALAVQRLARMAIWFGAMSTNSKPPAEARARREDEAAVNTVLARLSQAEGLIKRIAEDETYDGPSSARLYFSTRGAP